jgi:4-amino-4-deoxy-L-arabinose transferase-like glycosyltransferase
LTPLVARLTRHVADAPWALRLPATVAACAAVVMVALIARELGGGRGAQALAAWGYATGSLTLIFGHVLLTSTLDLPVWPAIVLFALKAQLRRRPEWWLAAGAVAGLSAYDKLLVAVLVAALAAGVVLVGPRRLLVSRWVLAGAALALLLGLPNLVYQARHGWPELSMGRALRAHNSGDVHVLEVPMLLLLLGPPLVPVWIAGLVSLWRRPAWRPVRFLAAAFPVLLVIVFAMGSQFYYPFGLLAALFAAGAVPTAEWARGARRTLVVAGVAVNAVVSAPIALPLIPLGDLGSTPVPAINQAARDTVGWPVYVDEVAHVVGGLAPADRARAVVVASNYGEAGAVARYGRGLPRVYSAQNQLYYDARPPAAATVAVVVGGELDRARGLFASCAVRARLDDRVGVDNEEQGEPVAVCRSPLGGWSAVWPALRHED